VLHIVSKCISIFQYPVQIMFYGSLEQGIALDCSDIDVAVHGFHFNKDKLKLIEAQNLLFEQL
jgi:DNA polymerase sigma